MVEAPARTCQVLIVDDHDGVRGALHNWIKVNFPGSRQREACDAEEALRLLERLSADVVLMDIGLPGMSGLDATRTLLKRWPQTAVVVVSINEGEAPRRAALAAGARAFVGKRKLRTELRPVLKDLLAGDAERRGAPR